MQIVMQSRLFTASVYHKCHVLFTDYFTILQHVLKLSALWKHVCFNSCTRLVNGCVSDALFKILEWCL